MNFQTEKNQTILLYDKDSILCGAKIICNYMLLDVQTNNNKIRTYYE